eukprot:COSAG01_NODE_25717_length_735_cov_51.888365_1_plen_34_part_01
MGFNQLSRLRCDTLARIGWVVRWVVQNAVALDMC